MTSFPRIAPVLLLAVVVAAPIAAIAQSGTAGSPAKSAPPAKGQSASKGTPAAKTAPAAKSAAPAAKSAAPAAKSSAPVRPPAALPAAPPAAAAKTAPKSAPAAAKSPPRPPAIPPALANVQPTLLGQYGDWGAYSASPNGRKLCFVLAKPKSSQTNPSGRARDAAYFFISSRPAENVKSEVSVISGYPYKPSSEATAEIGSTAFAMYTQNDGAWIKNVTDEPKMLDAMRKASTDMVVRGESGRGTKSTDTFSLKGISQALDRAEQECR